VNWIKQANGLPLAFTGLESTNKCCSGFGALHFTWSIAANHGRLVRYWNMTWYHNKYEAYTETCNTSGDRGTYRRNVGRRYCSCFSRDKLDWICMQASFLVLSRHSPFTRSLCFIARVWSSYTLPGIRSTCRCFMSLYPTLLWWVWVTVSGWKWTS
jgi:hypothetical protein